MLQNIITYLEYAHIYLLWLITERCKMENIIAPMNKAWRLEQ
jgi:hypothetical protein